MGFAAFFAIVFLFAGVGYALDVQLQPGTAQREVGGKVRVHIIATDVTDLISFGVEVGYNTCVLEVDQANTAKNTDFNTGFVMDPDGEPEGTQYTDPDVTYGAETCTDTFAAGTVRMMGGRLIGESTTGLDAPVLLGWITFTAVAEGESDLTINLYHNTSTFANFVGLGGPPAPVYDTTIPDYASFPAQRATICVIAGACVGDINGNGVVDMGDFSDLRAAMGQAFPQAGYDLNADLNGNGAVDMGDFAILRGQMGTSSCPVCPSAP